MLIINNQKQIATFLLGNKGKCKIEIINNVGDIIETIVLDNETLQLHYSKYNSGNYSIKLETEHQTILKNITIL